LEIKAKEKIAIVGLSGSGKSTILQLLLRFYDVDSGMVTLNGHDVKSLSFSDLRKNFSYISQDCFIFSGTIFENIAYADKSTTEADVEKIISRNPALHFINKLPLKMHNFVGEKGIKLSGGERQRIAIARAIIKDSPILLLDEATSALDNQNEQVITRAIADLAKEKTVITIAHKFSSVIHADRIIFVKDGEIAEIGSHHELIAWNGLYKKMYEAEILGE
jgi:ABC-type multidrug transport system fused ATPase/permease subunit